MAKVWMVQYATILSNHVYSVLFIEEAEARAFYEAREMCSYRHIALVDDIWHFTERSR